VDTASPGGHQGGDEGSGASIRDHETSLGEGQVFPIENKPWMSSSSTIMLVEEVREQLQCVYYEYTRRATN
jgi:hypothetical protein